MMQPFAQKKFVVGSSRKPRTARTVLLRMAADQERADRIRALKKEHLEYTWQAIADHVGVSLRAAQSWQEKGGIDYEHAKALAELWGEDLNYLMRGPREETPDLATRELAGLDHLDGRVERVEATVEDVRHEFRIDVDAIKAGVAANQRRLDEILEKLAGAEFANALEASEDQPGPGDAQREEPDEDEEDQDSRDSG